MATLSRRTEPQSARRAQIERSVIEATQRLLARGISYAELNVERIANEAGISRTAFYFYFRDKRELLMRATEELAARLETESERWLDGAGGPEELEPALTRIAAIYREHGPSLRAVVETSAYDESVAVFWRELIGRFVTRTTARIEAEQSAGRADAAIPAKATAFALCWMTERTCYESFVQDAVIDAALPDALAAVWVGTVYGHARGGPNATISRRA